LKSASNRWIPVTACSMVVFWPGAFIFGFPGIMAPYWQEAFGVGQGDVGRTHFFLLSAVGTFMVVSGRLQERLTPRKLVLFGSILCGGSMFLAGVAKTMPMIYLWAFLTGTSASFVLVPALTIAQKRLPERRGFASGLVNLSLGLSAAVISPPVVHLLNAVGYIVTTRLLGACAVLTGLLMFPFLGPPASASPASSAKAIPLKMRKDPLQLKEILRTRSFWSLWLIWGFAGAAGIATIILSTTFGLARGLSMEKAVLILTAFNLTNGASRFIGGFLSDIVGRRLTMGITFVAAGVGYGLFSHFTGLTAWLVMATVVGFSFGTVFAVSAPLIVDCFGMERFGTIFGMVFTAYAFLAGPLGPWFSGYLLDWTSGDFALVFYYLAGLCFISAFLVQYVTPSNSSKTDSLQRASSD
jgi:OFA family oxalate/formate antiporter-like MFS transporter